MRNEAVIVPTVSTDASFSPAFREWLASKNGSVYVAYLAQRYGQTAEQATTWLWEIARDSSLVPSRLTRSDLESQIPPSTRVRELKRELSMQSKDFTVFDRVLGTMLHTIAAKLRMGLLPDHSPQQITIYEAMHRDVWRANVGPKGAVRATHLQRIRAAAASLMDEIERGGFRANHPGKQPRSIAVSSALIKRLESLLQPIVYPHMEICRKHLGGDARSWYLYALALLIAARLVTDQFMGGSRRSRYLYLPGISPFHNNVINAGCVDMLKVFAPGDRRLTRSQREAVLSAASADRADVASVLEVIVDLGLALVIDEHKFFVGDGLRHGEFARPEHGKPHAKHLTQLQRYLSLGLVGFALRRNIPLHKVWASVVGSSQGIHGTLEYFLPDTDSVEFPVETTQAMVGQIMSRQYADKFLVAERYAEIRRIEKAVGIAIKKLNRKGHATPPKPSEPENLLLFPEETSPSPTGIDTDAALRDVILSEIFIDKLRVVRQTADDWDPVIHLDRLHGAVLSGKVATDPAFTWKRGGLIACIHPSHPSLASVPSMYLDIPHLRASCQVCRADLAIDPQTVPPSVAPHVLPTPASRAKRQHGFRAYEIDPRQFEFFAELQRLLHENLGKELDLSVRDVSPFLTPASWHLISECKLPPELAYERGCGFDLHDLAARSMIDSFGLELATHFGVVTWTDRPGGKAWLVDFLKSRGYPRRDWSRTAYEEREQEDGSKDVQRVTRYPVSALRGRLTFPLEFYGERVVDIQSHAFSSSSSRGLRRAMGYREDIQPLFGVPYGGFRADRLVSGTGPVVITETALESLASEVLTGHDRILSGGIDNAEFIEEAAFCGSEILLAYGHDEVGRRATKRAQGLIARVNPKARVSDLSDTFRQSHPDLFPHPDDLREIAFHDWTAVICKHPEFRFRI